MKRMTLMIAAALVLAISYTPSINAQKKTVELRVPATSSITGTVKVAIPFAFSVGRKSFEAGTYYIGPADQENEIVIRSVSGKTALLVLTNLVSVANSVVPPKLVFHKYGDQYFMAQAWLKYSDSGREFFVSPEELRMAREHSQETVVLAILTNTAVGIVSIPAEPYRRLPQTR